MPHRVPAWTRRSSLSSRVAKRWRAAGRCLSAPAPSALLTSSPADGNMQREGTCREMKLRRSYEKPSERRVRERAEAVRRYCKLLRKRMEREDTEATCHLFPNFVPEPEDER